MEKFKNWVQKYCKGKYRVSGNITRDGIIKAMLLAGKRSREQTIEEVVNWLKENVGNYWYDDCSIDCPEELIEDIKKAMKGE